MQVLYLGRAPRTKETQPDFREKCRVTRHSQVFCRLTGSQRTPRFWGVTTDCLGGLCYICVIFLRIKNMQIVFGVCKAENGHGFLVAQSGTDAW